MCILYIDVLVPACLASRTGVSKSRREPRPCAPHGAASGDADTATVRGTRAHTTLTTQVSWQLELEAPSGTTKSGCENRDATESETVPSSSIGRASLVGGSVSRDCLACGVTCISRARHGAERRPTGVSRDRHMRHVRPDYLYLASTHHRTDHAPARRAAFPVSCVRSTHAHTDTAHRRGDMGHAHPPSGPALSSLRILTVYSQARPSCPVSEVREAEGRILTARLSHLTVSAVYNATRQSLSVE